MKIEKKSTFHPIQITLETEQEVNTLYAIADYSPIAEWLERQGINVDELRKGLGGKPTGHDAIHRAFVDCVEDHVRKFGKKWES